MAKTVPCLLLVILLKVTCLHAATDAKVEYATPNAAGENGATKITLHGTDFPGDEPIGNTVPRKEVSLTNAFNQYTCDVHEAESDETQIVCYTRKMAPGTYYVRLRVDGITLDLDRYCNGNPSTYRCSVTVGEWRTPLISSVSWKTNEPQQVISISGRIVSDKLLSAVSTASNGIEEGLTRVYVTSGLCNLFNDTDQPYGVSLANEESRWGTIQCKIESQFVGNQNLSFIVDGPYGRSSPYATVKHVSADNRIYMFQTYAVVDDVNPKTGSMAGGTRLTITGKYFDNLSGTPAKVMVGGTECTVESVTDTQIVCITAEEPSAGTLYAGGRGFRQEHFDTNDIAANLNDMTAVHHDFYDQGKLWKSNFDDHITRTRGFFIPSTTANYKFLIKGSGEFKLFFNPNGKDAVEEPIKSITGSDSYDASEAYSLTAGMEYYLEIRRRGGSSSSANTYLAIYTDKTNYTPDETGSAITEKQKIFLNSTVHQEKQVVTLQGWEEQNATKSKWTVKVACQNDPCDGNTFALSVFGVNTVPIAFGSSAAVVQEALKSVMLANVVEDTEAPGYTIEFTSGDGHMALTVINHQEGALEVAANVVTEGVPNLKSFRFEVNGYISDPVMYNADASAVEAAVAGLFGRKCPSEIEYLHASEYFYQNMESSELARGAEGNISSEEAFCGSFSLKNPSFLFNKEHEAFNPFDYEKLCFAYLGDIGTQLGISYKYQESIEEETLQRSVTLTVEGLSAAEDWNHICIDLPDLLKSNGISSEQGIGVYALFLPTRADEDEDVFVDNIFVARSVLLTDEQIKVYQSIIRPSAVPHVQLSKVEVMKSDATDVEPLKYEITFSPIDCGHNFPVLGIAFGSQEGVGGYRLSASSKITVAREMSASPPMTGTFDLNFGSHGTLQGLAANITSEDLVLELESLNDVNTVNVVRDGSCYGYSYEVSFISPGGKYELMSVVSTNLVHVPDQPVTDVVEIQEGGLFMDPIGGDFFRVAHDKPQVQVSINNVPSHCKGLYNGASCDFEWSAEATPQVSNVSPLNGPAGTTVVISGSGFGTSNKVTIGGVECVASEQDADQITCALGSSPGGSQQVVVTSEGKGLATIGTAFSTFVVEATISSISPSSGSTAGCTTVVITGAGFHESSTVVIGETCEVVKAEYSTITCITSAAANAGNQAVKVTTFGEEVTDGDAYEYVTTGAGSISAITPTVAAVEGGTSVTITGSGFGTTAGTVKIGTTVADVTEWNDASIVITAPSLPHGSYECRVITEPIGCAVSTAAQTSLEYKFSVTSVSPTSGSLMGGTQVTVQGTGLSDKVQISFGDVACTDVISTDSTSLTCVTQSAGKSHVVSNTGEHKTFGAGYQWSPAHLEVTVGDKVTFTWSVPELAIGPEIGLFTTAGPTSKVFDGQGFNIVKARSGSYSHSFNNVGTYYFGSGCVDSEKDCEVFMRGVIKVIDADTKCNDLNAALGTHRAPNDDDYSFCFDKTLTPIVQSISPRNGTTQDDITITGSGFVSPSVKIGDKSCTVTSSTGTTIVCRINDDQEMPVGSNDIVLVHSDPNGNSRSDIENVISRAFALLPYVSSVSPSSGSLAGNTKITIEGSGFTDKSTVDVGWPCSVVAAETSYTQIVCETSSSSVEKTSDVVVTQSGIPASCTSTCSFSYDDQATPTVTEITSTSVEDKSSTSLVITGEGFGTDMAKVEVMIGEQSCTVSSLIDTSIECSVGRFAAGSNEVTVHLTGKGRARFDSSVQTTIDNPAQIDSVTPSIGSTFGGTTVTIVGNGFVKDETTVLVGDAPCAITSIDLDEIVCDTSAHSAGTADLVVTSRGVVYESQSYEYSTSAAPTISSISPTSGVSGDQITIVASGIAAGSDVTVTIGGVVCESPTASEGQVTCSLGSREGGPAETQVRVSDKGFSEVSTSFSYSFQMSSISPQTGSYGGSQVLTVSGEGFSKMSVVKICGNECVMSGEPTTQQITCLTPTHSGETNGDTPCDVVLYNGESTAATDNDVTYTYSANLTPIITMVEPSTGGTGGGTQITITGTNLLPGDGVDPVVTIDGAICTISSDHLVSSTQVICTTNEHQGAIKAKVSLMAGDHGIATQDNANFQYIDRWSSIFTWGGKSLPTVQDFVTIQKGQTILLDTKTAVLKMLLIDGGEVIFSEDEEEVSLHAENILIVNGGLLQIGTEEKPFTGKASIVMYGNLRSPELPIYGAKTLGVRNGTLDLHGRHVVHTWTVLTATAAAGATQINLKDSVADWQVGDLIAIASTGTRHSQKENERRTISAISADGKTLTLNEALEFEHLGVTETFAGKSVDFRAEVGLLSRNIVFRGTNDQAWHDVIEACPEGFNTGQFATQTCFQGRFGEEMGSDQFGASIMMHAQKQGSGEAVARIEYVELNYVGQAFRLGRYPIHWHLMGKVTGMYVRGCGIHQTFNRAVTIHGTHELLVERNVIFDIMGGAFFIEDGIETGNIIQYNLAIFVRQSTSLLNDDITPAAYWVTNPNNTIRHNHAAGGTHFGFWYRMHEHPDGPSFDASVCQQHVELGVFENNTAHSQGWFGLWIFQSYFPMEGGSCDSNTPSPAKFRKLTAWNCEKGAEWVNCGAIQFIDFVLINNEVAGIDAKLIKGTSWGASKGALVDNNLIVGHSNALNTDYETQLAIILPFSPGLTIKDTTFVNFDQGGVVFGVTSIQGTCVELCGGYYYQTQGLTFTDVTRKVKWRWEHEGVIEDLDGTLTGRAAGTKVVPYSGLVSTSDCEIDETDVYSSTTPPSAICSPEVRFHRFAINNVLPSSLEGNDIIFTNENGNTTVQYRKKRLTHKTGWMAMLTSKQNHRLEFSDAKQFTNISYNARFYDFKSDDYLYMTHNLLQKPDRIKINGETRSTLETLTALTPDNENLDRAYDAESGDLKFVVTGNKASSRRRRAAIEIVDSQFSHTTVVPSIYRCFYVNCTLPADPADIPPTQVRPEDTYKWSDGESPCFNSSEDGKHVIINASNGTSLCWVEVDVENINVDSITVYGVLEFRTNTIVSAIHILVQGGRLIAGYSEEDPFVHNLEIELRGDHSTPAVELTGVTLGSKALGCFGGCDLHGKPHDVYWTHLSQTANVGATTIVLQKPVDWKQDDEIVITTTGYSSMETEKNVIQSISIDATTSTIVLKTPLAHRHLGESYSVNGFDYDMRAEVGLLTRNIKIKGQDYANIDSEAFGARVLVGFTQAGGENYYGWARIGNVEFYKSGQEGWTDRWDPRFSLAWVNTGAPTEGRPSYVTASSFHDCYSTAIGVFGADNLTVSDNIVHRAIHDGIRLTGSNHRLEHNLVTVALFRGTYGDRNELTNFKDWQANFEVSETTDLIMKDNTAAGSERLCFHIDGEACGAGDDDSAWSGNVAHGCLHGVHIFLEDGVGTCSMIRNFVIYKGWDYGIYHQTQTSVVVRDTIVIDCQVGYMPLIYGPTALSHEYADKHSTLENVLFVGRSSTFDPALDTMDEQNDKNLNNRNQSPSRKAPKNHFSGMTAVVFAMFQGEPNGAPFKPFHRNMNYPTIQGLMNITGMTAQNYKGYSDGTRDLVFFTNPSNEDGVHPIYLSSATMIDVEKASKIFFDRPSLGKINPSDCVDMECDAKKKVLFKDLDGTFLSAPGAVVPQAEFGWDDPNETARGLGDYRIPATMTTATDGTRIPLSDFVDKRGIIRNDACTYVSEWQAYDCHGDNALDYRMLVIESMDEDTETRRLSPVALLGDRCIDLNNGPQDHGWCFGYTCQKRISTFYTIVATGKNFDIFFTGYAPRKLRFRVLNVDDSATVRVAVWYPRPERLDVYRVEPESLYIRPTNAHYNEAKDYWTNLAPSASNPDQYKPALDSAIHGDNYLDRNTGLLYIALRGSTPIEIDTVPMIIVKLGLPAVTVDDFFQENLVSNLANLLNIPTYKIRVVEVVRETSSRKRRDLSRHARSTDVYTLTVEIGDETRNLTTTTTELTPEKLNEISNSLLIQYQNGSLVEFLEVDGIISFASSTATTNSTTEIVDNVVVHAVPTALAVNTESKSVKELTTFRKAPTVFLLDSGGAVVSTLGEEWTISVSLDKSGSGANSDAELSGTTTVAINEGSAVFSDLMISHEGTGYTLKFAVASPATVTIEATSEAIDVEMREVNVAIIAGGGEWLKHGDNVAMTLQLQGSDGKALQNVDNKGLAWKVDVAFDDSSLYPDVTMTGTTSYTFDPSNGQAVINDLQLTNTESYDQYGLSFTISTEPSSYNFNLRASPITFISSSDNLHQSTAVSKTLELMFTAISSESDDEKASLQIYLHNQLNDYLNNSAYISSVNVRTSKKNKRKSSSTPSVTVDIKAPSADAAGRALDTLTSYLNSSHGLSFGGTDLTLSSTCSATWDDVCIVGSDLTSTTAPVTSTSHAGSVSSTLASDTTTTTSDDVTSSSTWVIIGVAIGVAVMLAAGAIILACFMKRSPGSKVGPGRCLGGSQTSFGTEKLYESMTGSSPSGTPSTYENVNRSRTGLTPIHV